MKEDRKFEGLRRHPAGDNSNRSGSMSRKTIEWSRAEFRVIADNGHLENLHLHLALNLENWTLNIETIKDRGDL